MNKKSLGHLLLISLVFLGAFGLLSTIGGQALAQPKTGTDGTLFGWAWSSNIGWLSFNSANIPGSTSEYSVVVDPVTKALSGYAWSSNLGWLHFDPTLAVAGPAGGGDNWPAKIEGNNKLTGWARFCSVYVSGCSGALKSSTELGGWDGWLKMIDVDYDPSAGAFSGFSWGNLNIGWLKLGIFMTGPDGQCPVDTVCGGCCPAWGVCNCGNGGPSVTCSVDPSSGPISTPFTWFVSGLSGFTGDAEFFTYDWRGTENLSGGGWSESDSRNQIVKIYSTPGPKTGSVTVTDDSGHTATADCVGGVTVNEPPCVPLGGIPGGEEVCCDLPPCLEGQTDSDPDACGCQTDETEDCTIEILDDKNIIAYNYDRIYSVRDLQAKIKIKNCSDGVDLATEGLSDTFTKMFLVSCSSNLAGDYLPENCNSLNNEDILYVWVTLSPNPIFPTGSISDNFKLFPYGSSVPIDNNMRFDFVFSAEG